jgi:hypothetical protein
MVKLERRVWMHLSAAGGAALLAVAGIAGCGGSGAGSTRPHSSSTTRSTGISSGPPSIHTGPLSLSPAHPTTRSQLTFGFTAPVASGVHGSHVISYSLSLSGPAGAGCVGVHEAGAPAVGRGARGQITVGPAELGAPWCPGRYEARLLELRSAHCTGSAPCPQYVAVAGLVGRRTFTIRHG